MNAKDIIELFSYSESEQETFQYLREYMDLINNKIPEIESDKEKLRRFALAGLFLTYRAFNHWGDSMTTEIKDSDYVEDCIHIERIKTFKIYFDETINDSFHYLSKIRLSILNFYLCMSGIRSLSKKLYKFVIK